jgi:uncharacterized protein YndB with AHSA1/START domain
MNADDSMQSNDNTESSDSEDRELGALLRAGDQTMVRYRRRLSHSPAQVWRALTEPERLASWFPTTVEGQRRAGAPLHFAFREMEGPPMEGEMLAYEPPSLLEMRWGDETLRFDLEEAVDGSLLVFTVTFHQIGKVARDGAGWHACLDLMACELDGRPAPWSSADRWRQVKDAYIQRFGPEASVLGPPEDWERVHG